MPKGGKPKREKKRAIEKTVASVLEHCDDFAEAAVIGASGASSADEAPMAAAPRKGGPEPSLWTVPDPTSGSEGVLRAGGGAGGSCASEGSVLGRDDTIEPPRDLHLE